MVGYIAQNSINITSIKYGSILTSIKVDEHVVGVGYLLIKPRLCSHFVDWGDCLITAFYTENRKLWEVAGGGAGPGLYAFTCHG